MTVFCDKKGLSPMVSSETPSNPAPTRRYRSRSRVGGNNSAPPGGAGRSETPSWLSSKQPPKPPCWRDFEVSRKERPVLGGGDPTGMTVGTGTIGIGGTAVAVRTENISFTDLNQVLKNYTTGTSGLTSGTGGETIGHDQGRGHLSRGSYIPEKTVPSSVIASSVTGAVGVPSASTFMPGATHATFPKPHHKKKHKLHRTRSQFSIDEDDLPDRENMTLTLAETKPKELGLRPSRTFDVRVYQDENTRRCQRWLASVKASEPLDDVAFAQGSGIDVEVPVENWEDFGNVKTPKDSNNVSTTVSTKNDTKNSRVVVTSHRKETRRKTRESGNSPSGGVGRKGRRGSLKPVHSSPNGRTTTVLSSAVKDTENGAKTKIVPSSANGSNQKKTASCAKHVETSASKEMHGCYTGEPLPGYVHHDQHCANASQ